MAQLPPTAPSVLGFAAYLARDRWPVTAEVWLPPGGVRMGIVRVAVGTKGVFVP